MKKIIILKNYIVENDRNYSYYLNNEKSCIARFVNENKIDNYCNLKPEAILAFKSFKNGNTHIIIDNETIYF